MKNVFAYVCRFLLSQAFESQSETKRKPGQSGSDQSTPEGPDSSPTDDASEDKSIRFKDIKEEANKAEQAEGIAATVIQEAAQAEAQEESPKKFKYPLGKARSAGLLEASNTDSGSSPEFMGAKNRPHRAMSEKSPSKAQKTIVEKTEVQQNESTTFVH